MGKYFDAKVSNYYLYYTSFDRGEPVHTHVSDKRLVEAGSSKIWVMKDGSTEVAVRGRDMSDKDLTNICRYITANHKIIFRKWQEAFGDLWIKGEPDKRYYLDANDEFSISDNF